MDVVALLEAKGIEVVFRGGDEISIVCPNQVAHSDQRDSSPSFNINLKNEVGHCFSCGLSRNSIGLTQWLLGEDLSESDLRVLKLRSNIRKQRTDQLTLVEPDIEVMFPVGEAWNESYRGISAETYRKVGAIRCERGRYTNRLVVEIVMKGNLVGLDARALGDEQPKYLRPKGCKAQEWLFPFDLAKQIIKEQVLDYCIIAEGLFHGLNAVDKGYPACCYFGANNFSQENVLQLLDLGVSEIVIFPDKDEAGVKAVNTIAPMLRGLFTISVANIDNLQLDVEASLKKGKPVYQDLGDLYKEEIEFSLEHRVRWK